VLVAASGSSAAPGPIDPAQLPLHRVITFHTVGGVASFRVMAYKTVSTLPPVPAPGGPEQLLLVSYSPKSGATPQLHVVRAVPTQG
jgi:hypothetical protein